MEAVGSIVKGNAQAAGYNAQAQANYYNAQVMQQNARVATEQANAREELQRRRFGELQGQAIAAAAQSGAGMEGSNADVLKQNAINAELDALTIRYEGEMQARGLLAQSELEQFQGRINKMNAGVARKAGYLDAAAALSNSATKAYTAASSGGK